MVHANRLLIQANKNAIRRQHRGLCCFVRLVDVRHATSSTFKDIKVGQAPKSQRRSSEPHNLSAAWAWPVVMPGSRRYIDAHVVFAPPHGPF
jgi:hypothetical protein